jgi:hypothetical protein
VSPNPIDAATAKRWFDCVEEIVFNDRDFYDSSPTSSPGDPVKEERSRGNLQALQAAYIVCLFQNWEGTDASKRRIRRYRYSNVVAVSLGRISKSLSPDHTQAARDIRIHNARHPDYSQQSAYEFAWIDFVMREELIRSVALCLETCKLTSIVFFFGPFCSILRLSFLTICLPGW